MQDLTCDEPLDAAESSEIHSENVQNLTSDDPPDATASTASLRPGDVLPHAPPFEADGCPATMGIQAAATPNLADAFSRRPPKRALKESTDVFFSTKRARIVAMRQEEEESEDEDNLNNNSIGHNISHLQSGEANDDIPGREEHTPGSSLSASQMTRGSVDVLSKSVKVEGELDLTIEGL